MTTIRGFPFPKNNGYRVTFGIVPRNRWSFQHIREILPTTEVWRGFGPVWQLAENPVDLDPISFTSQSGKVTTVIDWLSQNFADGIVVLHGGKIGMSATSTR